MENEFVIEIKISNADETPRQLCGTITELSDEDLGDFYYEILARITRGVAETEWIDNGVDDLECHCKKCGQEIFKVQKWFKFCPNCGRRVANI